MGLTIASYGGGTNSTAMLIECIRRAVKVDLILFADTGAERPHTYAYVEMFHEWLVAHGMPPIRQVRNSGMYPSLEAECLKKNCLPSLAYGFKTCSQKWKIRPQDNYVKGLDWVQAAWSRGEKITKLIGFDADEPQRAKDYEDEKFVARYPLIEWDMGRDECIETIKAEGLCLPGKSACFFCPSSRQTEIRQLQAVYPELADRALAIEAGAELSQVKGLGRNFAWADLLATADMFGDFDSTPELACGCYDG